jgi:phosphoglycolate phosphatase
MSFDSKIKCILFDLDNTLIDIPDPYTYFDDIIIDVMRDDFHLDVPDKSERDTLWRTGKEYITILNRWGVPDPHEFWELFDCRDEIKRRTLIEKGELIIYPDVIPVLEQLRIQNYQLGIITNSPSKIAKMELESYGLDTYFDLIIGLGETQEICKPEPDGILMALDQLNREPSEVIFVGDSTIDLIAAKRAHIQAILLDRTEIKKVEHEELSDDDFMNIPSFTQLLTLL